MLTEAQAAACTLAEQARTEVELERAHLAMQAAFPRIAEAYPCDCTACTRVRVRSAGTKPRV